MPLQDCVCGKYDICFRRTLVGSCPKEVKALEVAVNVLWDELPAEETKRVAADDPDVAKTARRLHEKVWHWD